MKLVTNLQDTKTRQSGHKKWLLLPKYKKSFLACHISPCRSDDKYCIEYLSLIVNITTRNAPMKKIPSYKAGRARREGRGPQKFWPAPGSIPILGIFLPFFTFYGGYFGGHGPFFGPNFFGANSGSRGDQNGQNWGVNGVITLKCGCYPLQRPPATLNGVVTLGHCDTRTMRLKSNVTWAYSRPMGPQQLVGAGFSSTPFVFMQWCIFCFPPKVLFGKSCTVAVTGTVTLDIFTLVLSYMQVCACCTIYFICYMLVFG